MNRTKIEWCQDSDGIKGETLNPQGWGCYGPGGTYDNPKPCSYCYARRMASRLMNTCELCNQFIPHYHPKVLEKPYWWKKPRKIFWQSMGDLFHPHTPDWLIQEVLAVVEANPQHTNIFSTKNPSRYRDFNPWPDNCWLLTTCENQQAADERIPELLKAEAPVLGVSFEPLLGGIDVRPYLPISNLPLAEVKTWWQCVCGVKAMPLTDDTVCDCADYYEQEWSLRALNCLILGAMTGPGSRQHQPQPEWVQSLIDQGRAANVPLFMKSNLRPAWQGEMRQEMPL